MVHQPHGHFGDAGGPFADLDAVELSPRPPWRDCGCRNFLLAGCAEFLEDFEFEQAQFAVGDDEEVAAAAGGVEECELAEFLVKVLQARLRRGAVVFDAFEFGAQVVEEQGADDFEDVALAGVVRADLAPLLGLHHGLKERAEDGGRDARPVETAAGQQRVRACRG